MGQVLFSGGGGSGVYSEDCTATANDIPKGLTALFNDSDDDIGVGTLELTGDATSGYVFSGKTFYNTDIHTKITGTMTVGSILNFSVEASSGRQVLAKWQNPYASVGKPFGGVVINYSTSGPDGPWTWLYTGYGNNTNSGGWSQVYLDLPNLNTTYYFSCTPYCPCSAGDEWGNIYGKAFPSVSCKTKTQTVISVTSSTNYTIPSGYSTMDIFCVGGGGGGSRGEDGSSSHNGSGGGGGGGGSCITSWGISVTPGNILNISIGAGGTSNMNNAITAGGTTSVSRSGTVLCSASGGGSPGYKTSYRGTAGTGGGNGGNGGGGYQANHNPGSAGSNGSASWTGVYYAGGGGGGGAGNDYGAAGGSRGGGSGGNGNAKKGGSDSEGYEYWGAAWGAAGEANTGGGGGGGGGGCRTSYSAGTSEGLGGTGGSGIVLIRLR